MELKFASATTFNPNMRALFFRTARSGILACGFCQRASSKAATNPPIPCETTDSSDNWIKNRSMMRKSLSTAALGIEKASTAWANGHALGLIFRSLRSLHKLDIVKRGDLVAHSYEPGHCLSVSFSREQSPPETEFKERQRLHSPNAEH